MHFFLLHNLYGSEARGGAERVVATIAHTLGTTGHRATVVTTCASWRENLRAMRNGGWTLEWVDGIRVFHLATGNIFPYRSLSSHSVAARLVWHAGDTMDVVSAFALRRLLAREQPDAVMTHNLKGLGLLAPRVIRSLGIPHIHAIHDVQLFEPSGLLGYTHTRVQEFGQRCSTALLRRMIGSPTVVIAPSAWILQLHRDRGFFPQSKTEVLRNPVAIPVHDDEEAPTPVQKDATVFRLLFVGQIERHKGIHFLLDALEHTGGMIGTTRLALTIGGSGSSEIEIRTRAFRLPFVTFAGFLHPSALARALAETDAIVVSSLVHENAPVVIVEAYRAGVPVIASRVGGVPELVQHEKTGWLFDAGDQESFLLALERAIAARNTMAIMKTAMTIAADAHDPKVYVERLLALIEKNESGEK